MKIMEPINRFTFLFCIISIISSACTNERGTNKDEFINKVDHYKIHLKIDPEQQFMEAKVNLNLFTKKDSIKSFDFYLHKQLFVHSISGEDLVDYRFDTTSKCEIRWMPEAGNLQLTFEKPLPRSKSILLQFDYNGNITEWPEWNANVFTSEWVELGLYFPWFPYNVDHKDFTFEVNVECDSAYQLRSYGDYQIVNGTWHFEWDKPTNDIIIVASKNLKTERIKKEDYLIIMHYVSLKRSTVQKITDDLLSILELYDNWFGGNKNKSISLIQSVREKGGGYARGGIIVLGGLKDEDYIKYHEGYIRYLGHEGAHIWWSNAPTSNWEDWLNEGFAEYSALMAVRKKYGQKSFNKRIRGKIESLSGSIPIWGFDRNDLSTDEKTRMVEVNLYNKGPVLLSELEMKIGKENFIEFTKELISNNISNTKDFLIILRTLEGEEISSWFEEMLKTR